MSLSSWKAPLAGGIVAGGLLLFLQYAYVRGHGGYWAALIRVGKESSCKTLIQADLGKEFKLAEDIGHDGQIMYLLARYFFEPDSRPILQQHVDHGEYRARRILYPALAGGFGQFEPATILIGLVGWCVAGAVLYGVAIGMLGDQWQLSPLAQCIALLNPGLISSGLILGCDTLALGLAMLGVALWLRDWRWLAIFMLTAAALTKDTYLIFALVVAWCELRDRHWGRALLAGIIPALTLALWSAYVHVLFQQDVAQGTFNFAWPGVGIWQAYPIWRQLGQEQLVQLGLTLTMLGGGVAALFLTRQPVIFWLSAAYVALGLITAVTVWQMPNNALRVLAPLWPLTVIAFAHRPEQRRRYLPLD